MLLLLAFALQLPASAARPVRPAVGGVGLVRMTVVDTAHADTMPALIWYPSTAAPHAMTIMLQEVDVAPGAPFAPAAGLRPLIVVSHGTGGNEMGHSDLAVALVRAGYVVVTFRHAGDNNFDHSAIGTDRQIYGRAAQTRAVMNAVLADAAWRGRLDSGRIGFFGYSAGGFTGLELAGAELDTARLSRYCREQPADPNYCAAGMRGGVELTGRYAADEHDGRVRAAALEAPAMSFMLDSASLHRVQIPLFIARATDDSVVREPYNVAWLVHALPRPPETWVVPGAGHYVFLAPCGPKLAAVVPEICGDAPGVDREAIHRRLDAAIVRFFDRRLAWRPPT